MRRVSLLGGVSVGLAALSSARGHVQPYYVPVPISADALAADPGLANYETFDLRVSVTTTPGSSQQDRFQVSTLDAALTLGNFYSPVGGGDIPVVPSPANLGFDTYITLPGFTPGMDPNEIKIPGSSDLLGPGSSTAVFPRAGEQQTALSATWGALPALPYLNGDYQIARLTVSKNATGPIAGYVLSRDVNSIDQQNFATLSFNNGVLTAAPGSEFALLGDANHDNVVNTADFSALSQHFNQPNSNWSNGDFNGDGTTNALDFNALATEFGTNAQAPALGTDVPEPIALGSLAIATIALVRRRRR